MDNVAAVIGVIGGILGAVAFFWQAILAITAYLHIEIKVEEANSKTSRYTVLVKIENKSPLRKRLDYAALLIGPENEPSGETLHHLAVDLKLPQLSIPNIQYLRANVDRPRYSENKQRAIVPLPFLYREQEGIGIEQISYRCTLDSIELETGRTYSVRFFVFEIWPRFIRSRATQDLLILDQE